MACRWCCGPEAGYLSAAAVVTRPFQTPGAVHLFSAAADTCAISRCDVCCEIPACGVISAYIVYVQVNAVLV